MKKRNKIIYWIATIWLALGMLSTGIVQLLHVPEEVDVILKLGYPLYFLTLLGIWKILGVIAVLIPKFPLLKEWAYVGFFFVMSGALFSHIASHRAIRGVKYCLRCCYYFLLWYLGISGQRIENSFQLINK